jgi:hypothetical protein
MSPRSQAAGSSNWIAILVAVITVGGSVAVAYISRQPKPDPPPSSATADQPATPSDPMSSLMVDMNLQGSDFALVPRLAQSAADCSTMCSHEPACKAMTFVSPNDCWLKTSVPPITNRTGMISAIKEHRP